MRTPVSVRAADQSLRRLVAEIAGASSSDVEAILTELDPEQAERTRTLLREYLGEEPAPMAPPVAEPQPMGPQAIVSLAGLSPWLAARLERSAAPEAEAPPRPRPDGVAPFAMTPRALASLQAAAGAVQPSPSASPEPPRPARWWRRLAWTARAGA